MILTSLIGGVFVGTGFSVYKILTKNKKEQGTRTKEEWEDFLNEIQIKNKAGKGLIYDYKNSTNNFALFYCPFGISCEDIKKKEMYFKIFLNVNTLTYTIQDNWLRLHFYNSKLPEFVPFKELEFNVDNFEIFLGKTCDDYAKIDFRKTPHLLISGMTGSGKSSLTHTILVQLYNHPLQPLIYLADLKRVELSNYKTHKNTIKYVYKEDETEKIIDELLEECEKRYEILSKTSYKKIETYNNNVAKNKQIRPIIFVIEECVRLVSNNNIQKKLRELLFIARACEIYVILTIQRPTRSCISPDIKSSLGNRIGLKTVNRVNSEVICDDDRLKNLKGNGHGWLFNDLGEFEFQGFYIQEENINNYLK